MYTRILDNEQYFAISKGVGGVEIRIPRYTKTDIYIGGKKEARAKGYNAEKGGNHNFYLVDNGLPVLKGYIAKPAKTCTVELRIPKLVGFFETGIAEFQREIKTLTDMFNESLQIKIGA